LFVRPSALVYLIMPRLNSAHSFYSQIAACVHLQRLQSVLQFCSFPSSLQRKDVGATAKRSTILSSDPRKSRSTTLPPIPLKHRLVRMQAKSASRTLRDWYLSRARRLPRRTSRMEIYPSWPSKPGFLWLMSTTAFLVPASRNSTSFLSGCMLSGWWS
jgi:hypothetical protein